MKTQQLKQKFQTILYDWLDFATKLTQEFHQISKKSKPGINLGEKLQSYGLYDGNANICHAVVCHQGNLKAAQS